MLDCAIYALEVGQGDSHVIFCGREVVVIDAGPRSSPLLNFLKHRADEYDIAALILTHNDADHCGGAFNVLTDFGYAKRIKKFISLQDRPVGAEGRMARMAVELAMRHEDEGLLMCERLERDVDHPKVLHTFRDGSRVKVLFPRQTDNSRAQQRAKPNWSSGVLSLTSSDDQGIGIWSGDLAWPQWQTLSKRKDNCQAQWFVLPHHGSDKSWDEHAMASVLDFIGPKWMVVSVGTSNALGHPSSRWIRTARQKGISVACTQITSQCHSDIAGLNGAIMMRDHFFKPTTGTACAGTIVYRCRDNSVLRFDDHQKQIRRLDTRLCI